MKFRSFRIQNFLLDRIFFPLPSTASYSSFHIISNKAVYYIVKQDGSLLASAELGVKCTSSPVMDSRGYLYVGIEAVAGASDMVCISSGATSYANSGWPMKGQNPQRTGLQK